MEVEGRTVLVRADLNVPMKDGRVADGLRIERLTPTLTELVSRGAKVLILSHFGRPKGKPNPALSLRPLAGALAELLGRPDIAFAEDCIGPAAERAAAALEPGGIALLENLRFHPGETENALEFAQALAGLGEVYVDDAFSCAHRAHASIEALARLLPAAAGRAMEAELRALDRVLGKPEKPVAAIIGGAKVSTKLKLLGQLRRKVQVMAIGGAMANTFLVAQGAAVGRSLFEPDLVESAQDILQACAKTGCDVVLPTDLVVARELSAGAECRTVAVGDVAVDEMILDIGPASAEALTQRLRQCRTLVWNGPVGAFETEPFDKGTLAVARAAAELTKSGKLVSVAGGGDTVAALSKAGVENDFTYVSAAGGAFLEWLEGRTLPGVEVLYAD